VQTEQRSDLGTAIPFLTRAFVVGVAIWVAASMILAIPHGPGHSIESMTPVVVLRDAALPLWEGALACVVLALSLRAFRSLGQR
jgi:hypothetical protein